MEAIKPFYPYKKCNIKPVEIRSGYKAKGLKGSVFPPLTQF